MLNFSATGLARLLAGVALAFSLLSYVLRATAPSALFQSPFFVITPNFIFGALFLTAAVYAFTWPKLQRRFRQRVILVACLCAAFLSLLALAEHFFAPHDITGLTPFPFPGRMSITAAIALLLLSISLSFTLYRRLIFSSQFLAFASLILCYFNLVANLFGVNDLYGAAFYSSMSVAASVMGVLMSGAILSLRPRSGFVAWLDPKRPGGSIALHLLPAVFLVPTGLGFLRLLGEVKGFFDLRFGLTLFTISNICVFSLLVFFTASSVNRLDRRRSKIQSGLDLSRHNYRSVIDSLPQLVWTCLPSGECDFLNDRWVAYTGFPAAQQLGFGWLEFVHPEDLDTIQAHWQAAVLNSTPLDTEYRIRASDATYRWFAARATPLRSPSGNILKWFGTSTDIDQLKRAESEIRSWNRTLEERVALRTLEVSEALNRLQSILDAASKVSIIATDTEGTIEIFNAGAEAMLGYSAQELVGKATPALLHLPEESQSRAAELSFLHGRPISGFDTYTLNSRLGFPETREWTYLHKDGRSINVHLAVSARRSLTGEVNGYVGIAIDISERVALQRRLLDQNLALESANLEAQAANKAKSEFLANMSHEIRTPMNGVIGMTGLLLDTDLTPEQSVFVETVRASGEALLTLINDILDFSKIESGKLELELIDFQLRPMLDATIQLLAHRAEEKGLELSCLIDTSLASSVLGDPGRLRQILLNLVGNAIKFTQSGEVKIEVSPDPQASEFVRFAVSDTGIGIPADRLNSLFAAFSQVETSTSRLFGGTGLGLAISKKLALLMGGGIGVSSQFGVGSTFWFRLPLKPTPIPSLPSSPIPEFSLTGQRILIVDDHETSRLLISNLLLSWGCLFETAANPFDTVQILRAAALSGTPFHIVIIDFRMPELSGDDLARLIRADALCSEIRLVLLTSITVRGHALQSQKAGFDAYLTKPIRQDDLREALELVVHHRSSTRLDAKSNEPIVTRHLIAETRQRRGRILLAEDNRTNQMVAVAILKKLGYWVEVVANGIEAIDALASAPYHLVLMDCQMPEMDGYTATQRIRAGSGGVLNAQIPIVAMTAFAMEGDREKCLASGMDDYLTKPVNAKELASKVERFLNSSPNVELPFKPNHPKLDQELKN